MNGVPGRLSYFRGWRGVPGWTRLWFSVTLSQKLRIVPEGLVEKIKKLLGGEEIVLGEPTFDRKFLIQGDPESWVRHTMDAGFRNRIQRMTVLCAGQPIFELGQSGLSIRCSFDLTPHRDLLIEFLGHGIWILRHLEDNVGERGIESKGLVLGKGRCPVCGAAAKEDIICCSRCQVPHHRECWEYFGDCAIFACFRKR